MNRPLLIFVLSLAACSSSSTGVAPPLDGGPLDASAETVAPASDASAAAPAAAADAPVADVAASDAVDAPIVPTRDGSLDVEFVVDLPGPEARVCDGVCPDAWAGAGCPCATLDQMTAACPGYRCFIMPWKPIGIGEGFDRTAEIRAADGHLCFKLRYQKQFGPDRVDFFDNPDAGLPLATYGGISLDDFYGTHDLTCDDGRTFAEVTESQCSALAMFRICDAPDAGAP